MRCFSPKNIVFHQKILFFTKKYCFGPFFKYGFGVCGLGLILQKPFWHSPNALYYDLKLTTSWHCQQQFVIRQSPGDKMSAVQKVCLYFFLAIKVAQGHFPTIILRIFSTYTWWIFLSLASVWSLWCISNILRLNKIWGRSKFDRVHKNLHSFDIAHTPMSKQKQWKLNLIYEVVLIFFGWFFPNNAMGQ